MYAPFRGDIVQFALPWEKQGEKKEHVYLCVKYIFCVGVPIRDNSVTFVIISNSFPKCLAIG